MLLLLLLFGFSGELGVRIVCESEHQTRCAGVNQLSQTRVFDGRRIGITANCVVA